MSEGKHKELYRITADGKVFSVASNWRGYGEREMRQTLDSSGYLSVRITVEGEAQAPARSPACRCRISRAQAITCARSPAPRRRPVQQCRYQPEVGHARRKRAGPRRSRTDISRPRSQRRNQIRHSQIGQSILEARSMTFTPGPWKVFLVEDGPSKGVLLGVGQETGEGITDPNGNLWRSGAEQMANAYLIAAAPDLLASLKDFVSYGCPQCSGDCASANPPVVSCPMQDAARAIAKAEGRS